MIYTRVDLSGGTIAIRSLKKRRDATARTKGVYRTVPVPPDYLDTLNTAHGIREAQKSRRRSTMSLWPLSRVRVWQIVKRIMIEAGIPDAPQRSPKGLRHGFGIHATVTGVPLHMLSKWVGHAQLSTTAIYADAVDKEEQDIAARMWGLEMDLTRSDPEANLHRYSRMEIVPGLFGDWGLIREWGRIGRAGQMRTDW